MPVQVTIIGLGRIGGSMGMALAAHSDKVFRVGHDKAIAAEREAQKMGAVDKTEHNLLRAVQGARLVILSLPAREIKETLELIAPDLKQGTVVLDTSPVKAEVAKWARDLLPEGSYYVGLMPAIGAGFLQDEGTGLASAGADLFSSSIFLVSAPSSTPGDALELASNFVKLLGATPLLTDILESDGLATSTHLLPQLISAALLNATVDQPGWNDARKIASRAYSLATSGVGIDDHKSLLLLTMQDRANVVRLLDTMIASLRGLREDVEKGDEAGLKDRLEAALEGRQRWMHERLLADWTDQTKAAPMNVPSLGERLFGGAFAKKPRRE